MSTDETMQREKRKRKAEESVQEPSAADLEKQAAIDAAHLARIGGDPYGPLIGQWVLGIGVREHIRGRLDAVFPFAGGARLVFADGIYHLDTFDEDRPSGGDGEKKLGYCVMQESGFLWFTPQPSKWPQKY